MESGDEVILVMDRWGQGVICACSSVVKAARAIAARPEAYGQPWLMTTARLDRLTIPFSGDHEEIEL